MKAAAFHWFIAWRYLMARPRRISPAVVAFAGMLLIASTAASVIGGVILRRGIAGAFGASHLPGPYDTMLISAVIAGAAAALVLLAGLVRYCQAYPGRLFVPLTMVAGMLLVSVGAIAYGARDALTHTVSLTLLGLGLVLVILGVLRYRAHAGHAATGPLVFVGMMAAGSASALVLARSALAPLPDMATYPADALVLPGLALWVAGMVSAVLTLVRYMDLRRVSRMAVGTSLLMLLASAVYPRAARRVLGPGELIQFLPTGDQYALPVQWASMSLLGLGALVLLGLMLRRMIRGPRRGLTLGAYVVVACLVAGVLGMLLARLVLSAPEVVVISLSGTPNHPVQLTAVALLAIGELAVMLAVCRYVFTFFTTVSIAGVSIGSMALVIVLSVMSGFESDLRDKILGSNAHVLITKEEGSFTEYRDVAQRIENIPGVVAHTPYLVSEVVIAANNNYANVIIKGIDPGTIGNVTELGKNVEQPRALERLYPLADDGGILGPPTDAGAGQPNGQHDQDGAVPAGQGPDSVDPPPPDLDVDIDEPQDFSGGEQGPGDEDEDMALPAAGEPGRPAAAAALDPRPADLRVDIDEPEDFSDDVSDEGAEEGSRDLAVAEVRVPGDAGSVRMDDLGPGDDGEGDRELEPEGTDDPERGPMIVRGEDIAAGIFELPENGPPNVPGDTASDTANDIFDDELGDEPATPRIPPRVARLPGVLVGKELVKQIHLYVGQEVRIVSPLGEDTPAGPVPRTAFMRVAGIFFTGMYEYDLKFVYVPLYSLQSFLDLGDEVSGIEVRIADPDRTEPVLDGIRSVLPPGYRVQDWKEINRNLFSALKLEKIAMFLVLAIIILVASFSIIGNLVMVVVEKAKEIAIIKTLGSTDMGVVKIFVAQGFFIGIVGTLLGVAHGLVACALGSKYGLPLDPEVYYIDRLPIHVEAMAILAVAIAGVLISVIATLYPASVGARLRPLEGLRYD